MPAINEVDSYSGKQTEIDPLKHEWGWFWKTTTAHPHTHCLSKGFVGVVLAICLLWLCDT